MRVHAPGQDNARGENPTTVALAKLLGPQGRYAVFNPAQALPARYKTVIHEIGTYDLPILHQIESVQGYGSAVAGRYADATGSHEVENLQPAALTRPNLDILNLRELVTLPEYLVAAIPGNQPIPLATGTPVPPGTSPEAEALNAIAPLKPLRALPPTLLLRGRSSTWMLPGPLALDSVTVVLIPYRRRLPGSLAVGILDARDQIASDRQVQVVDSRAQMALTGRVAYGIQVGAPGGASIAIAAVAVSTRQPTAVNSGPSTHRLVLNQVLQGVLEPPRWRYQTEIGGLPVFTDTIARGATWLERAGSETPLAPLVPSAHASTRTVQPWQNPVTVFSTPRPAVLVRSVAYESGWRASLAPIGGGPPVTVRVRQLGLVQAISVPAGSFTVTWIYTSRRATLGLLVSAVSTIVLALLVVVPRRRRRSKGARTPAPSGRGTAVEAAAEHRRQALSTRSPGAPDAALPRAEGTAPA